MQYPNAMGGFKNASSKSDLTALEALQANASELEQIARLLDRFNVFETIGFTDQELMHSRFLAFLLDPRQSHALGDLFIKGFLKEVLFSADKTSRGALYEDLDQRNLHERDLRQTLVRREYEHVDILLTNEAHKFALVIENKTWTTEHDDQLNVYYQIVKHTYPDWLVFGIYLTPRGAVPFRKEDRERYLPLSYEAVCKSIVGILEDAVKVDDAVRVSIEQYAGMVGRKLLENDEIVKQCQEIYDKHSRALDLIWKYRRDAQEQIKETVEALITHEDRLELDGSRKDLITFGVKDWDTPALLIPTEQGQSRRMLLFEFWNDPKRKVLNLNLFIQSGPGHLPERLREIAKRHRDVFRESRRHPGERHLIFQRAFLAYDYYEGVSHVERERRINRHWHEFLEKALPRIEAALEKETWIWNR